MSDDAEGTVCSVGSICAPSSPMFAAFEGEVVNSPVVVWARVDRHDGEGGLWQNVEGFVVIEGRLSPAEAAANFVAYMADPINVAASPDWP